MPFHAFISMSGSKGWLRLERKELIPICKLRINHELGGCCLLFEDLKDLHRSLQTWSHLFSAVIRWSHLDAEVLPSFPLGNWVMVPASFHPFHSTLRCTWAHLTPLSPVWWPCLLFMHCVQWLTDLIYWDQGIYIYWDQGHTVSTPAAGPGLINTSAMEGSSDHSGLEAMAERFSYLLLPPLGSSGNS